MNPSTITPNSVLLAIAKSQQYPATSRFEQYDRMAKDPAIAPEARTFFGFLRATVARDKEEQVTVLQQLHAQGFVVQTRCLSTFGRYPPQENAEWIEGYRLIKKGK